MKSPIHKAVAIVGVGSILPQAPNSKTFWNNIKEGKYSISEVPTERWDPDLYFDPDPKVPDKTYSKIGGWATDWEWDPLKWRMPIPPKVSDAMDVTQKMAIAATREALAHYGYPERKLNPDRTAVILGNAMGGDKHLYTASRVFFPEFARELAQSASFSTLETHQKELIIEEMHSGISNRFPEINEDTMPGELSNIAAGRIAALYNFRGPNFITDAACASALAAITSAIEGLEEYDFDAVITGGVDANMSPSTFVKFCKIGALSATGTRPYAKGADGFVMGEGSVIFILKRLDDAERDGDDILAVIRGVGGSSDGKGKGITAPNPSGQKTCLARAWENAGVSAATASLIEGHGTSTSVGDATELMVLDEVFREFGLKSGTVALGSVKSNIGHLKGAAGAAGILKAAFALHDKVIPPSLNFEAPNPNIDFSISPFYVNTQLKSWTLEQGLEVRRAGVSAFGFGGTNFHAVLEEYIPGRIAREYGSRQVSEQEIQGSATDAIPNELPHNMLFLGSDSDSELLNELKRILPKAEQGWIPPRRVPTQASLELPVRLAIDFKGTKELVKKIRLVQKALETNKEAMYKALRPQGVFLGRGVAPKVAFLFTGQGSQFVNMLSELRKTEPIVNQTFKEADEVMTPLLGRPLSSYIFNDPSNKEALEQADKDLRQTEITQPAVLATDIALFRLIESYGIKPDMVMGHSLGEYGALVASGAMPFAAALRAVSARGTEMSKVQVEDKGLMAAIFGPLEKINEILGQVDGYVEVANINSFHQAVIGGSTKAVQKAVEMFKQADMVARPLPVSHAFHSKIVASASAPLGRVLRTLNLAKPKIPIVANVTGEFYPSDGSLDDMIDLLARQVSSPVQFVKGLQTLYDSGARMFVEIGPKRALYGFVEDVLGNHSDVLSLYTNHPKVGESPSVNQALCGFYSAGLGKGREENVTVQPPEADELRQGSAPERNPNAGQPIPQYGTVSSASSDDKFIQLGHLFADFMKKGFEVYQAEAEDKPVSKGEAWITGASMGLPGVDGVFQDSNLARLLHGEQFIGHISDASQKKILDKHITRLVKTGAGGPRFEEINQANEVIRLAGIGKELDLVEQFGFPADRIPALDIVTQLAIGAGLDALRDAGIPLKMHYKTTTKETLLPDRWLLPESMRDDTGIIFASAFPGVDSLAKEFKDFYSDSAIRSQIAELEAITGRYDQANGAGKLLGEVESRIKTLKDSLREDGYQFDRRFLFRVLSMGHSQFAEYIGAKGPNTQINSACASSTQAVSLAKDWIQVGRCQRVIIISADDITTDNTIDWFGSGFLASGAAATDDKVETAALPFDKRRHGMIVGMGAAALVVESPQVARKRGLRPICEVLSSVTANSGFHGTRLDVDHIAALMDRLVSEAETNWNINRFEIAPETVFVSHETYTPARGGSASAEINALRYVFKKAADEIVIANTKGFTGHAMGTGIEDVLAVKALETGIIPPVPNFKEIDPDLGSLNLSKGGKYPVQYALRLAAGFGSQISMILYRWTPSPSGSRPDPADLGFIHRIEDTSRWNRWLQEITGTDDPELEVNKRTLRIKDPGLNQVASAKAIADKNATIPEIDSHEIPAKEEPKLNILVQDKVLEIVARITGYPTDMLSMDLDLEADLGIDTVKQAETFAAIREAYEIPREENMQLRDYPTLAHAVQFVLDRSPGLEQEDTDPVPVGPSNGSDDSVTKTVLGIVADQTGYPSDMLDLDLDMEADLGIDTVKQAETFAAIRENFDIPRDENLQLRDYPTLAHTIDFVYKNRPDLRREEEKTEEDKGVSEIKANDLAAVRESANGVSSKILSLVADQTGYPPDMLDLELDLEADLGIDTVKQAEMFAAIREEYDIPRDENLQLRDYPTLAHTIEFVYKNRPDLVVEKDEIIPEAGPVGSTENGPEEVVRAKVMEIVADQTGYPPEMLDMDLDLEADLGIDTVKQAETFAAIREEWNIPRDENLQLRDYPTLNHTVQFVFEKRPDLVAGLDGGGPISRPSSVQEATEIAAAGNYVRRVPVVRPRPGIDYFKSTGIVIDKESRILVAADLGGVAKSLAGRLRKMGAQVKILNPMIDEAEYAIQLDKWIDKGPTQGIFWLPGLDLEDPIKDLDHKTWTKLVSYKIKLLFRTLKKLSLNLPESANFLVTATRMGGLHGMGSQPALAPLGGGITGLTKAFKRENPPVITKSVDFELMSKPAFTAQALINETILDPGTVEVGYQDKGRWGIGLKEEPLEEAANGLELGSESVYIITGAAGSIVSAITADLATSGGTFHLLDLAPEPDPNDQDLHRFKTDREGLKKGIFDRLKDAGQRATPAEVTKRLAALERAQSASEAMQSITEHGGTVVYHQLDLRDGDRVKEVIDNIKKQHQTIDVLVHAGGLEISHFIPDKTEEEFDLVFDVKSNGWYNIIHSMGDTPLGAAVVFSSIAGRLGNGGQTDYSAANDFLCKSISNFRITRPGTVGIAIDWTAWGEIGMASRGSIPTMMKQAGIDMLSPSEGIPIVGKELIQSDGGEIVIAGNLGILTEEFEIDGGIDPKKVNGLDDLMVGGISKFGLNSGLVTIKRLDPKQQPFLFDHKIDETPVLPGVMGIEAMTEAAKSIFPGWQPTLVNNIFFRSPFKFYQEDPRDVIIRVEYERVDKDILAHGYLIGSRILHGQDTAQETIHFEADIRLSQDQVRETASGHKIAVPRKGIKITSDHLYQVYFHGPAYQVVAKAWKNGDELIGNLASDLPDNHAPGNFSTVTDPRLVELCFQTAGIWEMGTQQVMGLPSEIKEIKWYAHPSSSKAKLYAVVKPSNGAYDAEVMDSNGSVYLALKGYKTAQLPGMLDKDLIAPLKAVFA